MPTKTVDQILGEIREEVLSKIETDAAQSKTTPDIVEKQKELYEQAFQMVKTYLDKETLELGLSSRSEIPAEIVLALLAKTFTALQRRLNTLSSMTHARVLESKKPKKSS